MKEFSTKESEHTLREQDKQRALYNNHSLHYLLDCTRMQPFL